MAVSSSSQDVQSTSTIRRGGWFELILNGPFCFAPSRILPEMPGTFGVSVGRTLAATTLLAVSLGVMQLVTNTAAGAAVIPLWFAAIGAFVDGYRGALRAVILAILFPIYCALLFAIAFGIFWIYAVFHSTIAGDAMLV